MRFLLAILAATIMGLYGQNKPAPPAPAATPETKPLTFQDVGFAIPLQDANKLRLDLGFTTRQLHYERLQTAETQLAQICASVVESMKLDPNRWNCYQDGTIKRAVKDPEPPPPAKKDAKGDGKKEEKK